MDGPRSLRKGVVHDLARNAGIEVRHLDKKCPIRCPFHADKHPSAFLDPTTNAFYCSVCTPNGGWSARRLAEALGVLWPPPDAFEHPGRVQAHAGGPKHDQAFTPIQAREVWQQATARARDDERVNADRAVYEFVARRGLAESWEDGLFGILSVGMDLPGPISRWPSTGHRLLAPLYDGNGEITNVQARTIGNGSPKTLFPAGSRAAGTLFASSSGMAVLRGDWTGTKRVLFGEGLTDFLALASISPIPVLCAPGTSMAAPGIGAWVSGYEVLVALDCDEAGSRAVQPTADRAYEHGATRVRQIEWPGLAKDACEVVEQVGLEGLADFLAQVLTETGR